MKIVVNRCFGGFGLSEIAKDMYKNEKGIKDDNFYGGDIERNDPALVLIVETLGKAANGNYADLEIVDIPDDVEWYIHEYDGNESVYEKHRSW